MAVSNTTISPLRQRFIDDMSMRKLAPHTQSSYILGVKNGLNFWAVLPIPPLLRICVDSSCKWSVMAFQQVI